MSRRVPLLLAAALVVSGCVTPGPFIRVANASPADFERVKDEDVVWYEFQPGDLVPFNLLLFGAIEGGAADVVVKAKRSFFLVARKNAPMMVSYDGQSISGHRLQSIIAVVPRRDGKGGEVGWMTYLGESMNPEEELEKAFKDAAATPSPETSQR